MIRKESAWSAIPRVDLCSNGGLGRREREQSAPLREELQTEIGSEEKEGGGVMVQIAETYLFLPRVSKNFLNIFVCFMLLWQFQRL